MSQGRKILVLQLHHLFGIHPIHHTIIQSLLEDGGSLDLVYADYPDSDLNLSQYDVEKIGLKFYHGKNIILYVLSLISASYKLWRLIFSRNYAVMVMVEPQALMVMLPLFIAKRAFHLSTKVVYVSLEILFMNELKKWTWRQYKNIESWCSRQADIVVSQDDWRKELLSLENKIPSKSMLCIPNCEYGVSKYSKSFYLHDHLGINRDKRILLCLGTPSFMSVFLTDLLENSQAWNEDWVLVIHSGVSGALNVPVMLNGKVYFTTTSLPAKDVGLLYQSADVGLAIYIGYDGPTGGKNLDCVGYSSGKFNMFLKYGKPVITTNQYTFKEIFHKSKCGISIESFAEIPYAMKIIKANYSEFSQNASRFYNSELNVKPYVDEFIRAIK